VVQKPTVKRAEQKGGPGAVGVGQDGRLVDCRNRGNPAMSPAKPMEDLTAHGFEIGDRRSVHGHTPSFVRYWHLRTGPRPEGSARQFLTVQRKGWTRGRTTGAGRGRGRRRRR